MKLMSRLTVLVEISSSLERLVALGRRSCFSSSWIRIMRASGGRECGMGRDFLGIRLFRWLEVGLSMSKLVASLALVL